MIIYTNQHEMDIISGTSYLDCFKGPEFRRTEIACLSWTTQVFSGFAIHAYITYFFTLAGLSPANSYKLALEKYSTAFVGTVASWLLQSYVGQRKIFLYGLATMTPIMWIVGFLALAPATGGITWAQSVLLLVWFGAYGLTIGPIPFVIASEISSSRLRSKTLGLARNSCYVMVVMPNPAQR
jgi:SP family general alpha glucoside:H+ symporter-like MFS transporter